MGKKVIPYFNHWEEHRKQLHEDLQKEMEFFRAMELRFRREWNGGIYTQPVTLNLDEYKPKKKRKEVKRLP